MGNAKIVYGSTTLMDLTGDTVEASKLANGYTAHGADGNLITGTAPVSVESKDIDFYDYDGTRVASWTLAELASKTALPDNPSHTGLVAQGWNWTLQEIKDWGYQCDVGQFYMTSDGKPHFFVEIKDLSEATFSFSSQSGSSDKVWDWGDGSSDTYTGSGVYTAEHTYSAVGKYEITVETLLNISSVTPLKDTAAIMTELWMGNNFTSITPNMTGLRRVAVKRNATGMFSGAYFGQNARSLEYLTVPAVTEIKGYTMYYWRALKHISFSPTTITSFSGYVLTGQGLQRLVLPYVSGTIGSNNLTEYCQLKDFIVASGIATISSAICQHALLNNLRFLGTTPPTLSSSSCFGGKGNGFKVFIPYDSPAYLSATNYPSSATYPYLGFGKFSSGAALPGQTTDGTYDLTWYGSVKDALDEENAITTGNGGEVYARYEAVSE